MNLEGPAKHQPKTSTVEDEDEWEDALVVSYVPQPIAWDDHPTGRQLNKLLQAVQFEQTALSNEQLGGNTKACRLGKEKILKIGPYFPHKSVCHIQSKNKFKRDTMPEVWTQVSDVRVTHVHIS